MHRRLDEKKHEIQSSWDEVYASDKIGPLGGGGSLSLPGHHKASYTLAHSATQVAADEHVWDVSLPRGRDTPAQAARDMPATETVKASLFSPLSTIQPSDFGFDDTQAWVDAQRRRSPHPVPSPHVQAGPQKSDLEREWDERMKEFDDDDETRDWANVGQLPKKLDSPAQGQAVDAEIPAPPPVVKPTKDDKGKQKLIAATPDLSHLQAKVPAPQVLAAQAETAVAEKVTTKAPKKTETPAPQKLTVKEPAMPHGGPTTTPPAPAPKEAEAQPTKAGPSGRPAVQTVGTSSSVVKGGNQDVLFLPGEPPAPPPSAPPPADGWQVAEGKKKQMKLPNLGIIPPSQLRQSSVAKTQPQQFYGQEPVFISPVADRQKVIEKQVGDMKLLSGEEGVPIEPLQLYIPSKRWFKHCSPGSVRSGMVQLMDKNLSLSYVSIGADPTHPTGFYLNVNLRSNRIKRTEYVDYAWVETYLHLLCWKEHYPDLAMHDGFFAARKDSTSNQVKSNKPTASASSSAVARPQAQGRAVPAEKKHKVVTKASDVKPELSKAQASKLEADKIRTDVQSRIGKRTAKEAKYAMVKLFRDLRSPLYGRAELALIVFHAWKEVDEEKHLQVATEWYHEATKNCRPLE